MAYWVSFIVVTSKRGSGTMTRHLVHSISLVNGDRAILCRALLMALRATLGSLYLSLFGNLD